MKTLISWSGGKDSTATIILAHELNIHIDEIIFCEVMYDRIRGISGEMPEFIKWIKEVAIPKLENWGYKVTILHANKDFLDLFFHRVAGKSRKNLGKFVGYMIPGMCWANRDLKVGPIKEYLRKQDDEIQQFIGIAADEPKRLARLKAGERSLLAENNLTEMDARIICERYELLAPTYSIVSRGGCWFCPNAKVPHYAYMKSNYPELYNEFIGLANSLLATRKFAYNITIDELDKMVNKFIDNQERQGTFNFEETGDNE